MPTLPDPRQESYAKQRAKGIKPPQAATIAGYAPNTSTTHLEKNEDVKARIMELISDAEQERAVKHAAALESAKIVGKMTGLSRSWVLQQLANNAASASAAGAFKESNVALIAIGKDLGMFNGSNGDADEGDDAPEMDLDDLDARLNENDALRPQIEVAPEKAFSPEMLNHLLGDMGKKPDLVEARKLTTGSETDVALLNDYGTEDEPVSPASEEN